VSYPVPVWLASLVGQFGWLVGFLGKISQILSNIISVHELGLVQQRIGPLLYKAAYRREYECF